MIADGVTFSKVISCACKARNSKVVSNVFSALRNSSNAFIDDSLFMDTLKLCSLTGDHKSALGVIKTYEECVFKPQPQAYTLLVMVRLIIAQSSLIDTLHGGC